MNAPNLSHHTSRPIQPDAPTHLYAVGQAVRLKGAFMRGPQAAGVYRITGTLPPRGEVPQYRLRSQPNPTRSKHKRQARQRQNAMIATPYDIGNRR